MDLEEDLAIGTEGCTCTTGGLVGRLVLIGLGTERSEVARERSSTEVLLHPLDEEFHEPRCEKKAEPSDEEDDDENNEQYGEKSFHRARLDLKGAEEFDSGFDLFHEPEGCGCGPCDANGEVWCREPRGVDILLCGDEVSVGIDAIADVEEDLGVGTFGPANEDNDIVALCELW